MSGVAAGVGRMQQNTVFNLPHPLCYISRDDIKKLMIKSVKSVIVLFVIARLLLPDVGRAAQPYIKCDFTGGIDGSYIFGLRTEDDTITGISVVKPNWGTMQLDPSNNSQLIAHVEKGTSGHPDAIFTIIVNRVTGYGSAFYSKQWKNPADLFWEDSPIVYQEGKGQCGKYERAF